VTSGAFLIAAEARISTATKYWDSPSSDESPTAPSTLPAAMPQGEMAPTAPPAMKASSQRRKTPAAASVMKPAAAQSATPQPPSKPPATTYYTCPMHPQVHSPVPGKCPICGMDLVPKTEAPAP
ncbi:MAG TPA: heavy metal-binding domain-containing protein, partial [Polyangiaceae bacterium]|nr:heavy metal-binding domain-containing protein [Polyangiaceae bacterium]